MCRNREESIDGNKLAARGISKGFRGHNPNTQACIAPWPAADNDSGQFIHGLRLQFQDLFDSRRQVAGMAASVIQGRGTNNGTPTGQTDSPHSARRLQNQPSFEHIASRGSALLSRVPPIPQNEGILALCRWWRPMTDTATMHIDGAARGNPGPAAYAIVLARPGLPVVEVADIIGKATNNVAEYTALVEGLQLATELGVKKLSVFSDSELMVKQMNGEYRVKNPELLELYNQAKRLAALFETLTITHVRREQNARADAIGNDALDGKPRKRGNTAPTQEEHDDRPGPMPHHPTLANQNSQSPSDARVRSDALIILRSAAQEWANRGVGAVPVEAIWEQLWSVLEEGNVLKKPKKR